MCPLGFSSTGWKRPKDNRQPISSPILIPVTQFSGGKTMHGEGASERQTGTETGHGVHGDPRSPWLRETSFFLVSLEIHTMPSLRAEWNELHSVKTNWFWMKGLSEIKTSVVHDKPASEGFIPPHPQPVGAFTNLLIRGVTLWFKKCF